jgi:hypothetical protein
MTGIEPATSGVTGRCSTIENRFRDNDLRLQASALADLTWRIRPQFWGRCNGEETFDSGKKRLLVL